MKIEDIITILENKIEDLHILKNMALNNGDLESLVKLEQEINETEISIFALKKDNAT